MSEQLLYDKHNRGTKRPCEDHLEYFVAGSAEIAGNPLDRAARKIRKISSNDFESQQKPFLEIDVPTSPQSSQDTRCSTIIGEHPKPTRKYKDMPKLIRSRSENDKQISWQKFKSERSKSQTYEPRCSPNLQRITEDCILDSEFVKNIEQKKKSYESEEMPSHCKVCLDGNVSLVRVPGCLPKPDASYTFLRDEVRCRNCERVLSEKPGFEDGQTAVKSLRAGPKPTGIVVGIKQAPEVKQSLEIGGSKCELKKMLKSKAIGLDYELKQLLECRDAGSEKPAKDSGMYIVIPEDDDEIYMANRHNVNDLDVLHFSIVKKDAEVTWANSEDHAKNTGSSRDKLHTQQWETYSLKLEQEQTAKNSCNQKPRKAFNIKRNSWEELKKKFSAEEKCVSEDKRDTVSDVSERENVSESRENISESRENALDISCCRSYKFQASTKRISQQYKRRKLSDESGIDKDISTDRNSNTAICESQSSVTPNDVLTVSSNAFSSEKNTSTVNTYTENTVTQSQIPNVLKTTTKPSTNPPKDVNLLLVTEDSNSRIVITTSGGSSILTEDISNVNYAEKVPPNIPEFSPSEEKPNEIRTPKEILFEANTRENQAPETNTWENDSYEIRPSDIGRSGKNSYEIQSSEITPSEKEPPTAKSPQQRELSLQEWTEILQGRIEQVKESIEEEKTPWKTKNKKKVLEKLENHMAWMTGPSVDEAFFCSRKLQFFQTMRKQYDLMNIVKTQRQSMKCLDSVPQVVENVEKPKAKAAKEVRVGENDRSKKTKEVKKTVKCRPKNVKKNEGTLMKKIRKAVAL